MSDGELRADGISKVFPNGVRALDGVSFSAHRGRVLTLLGPSGCGKSTLLRIVAGLESATSGTLQFEGRPLHGVAPGERQVGFVFQNYALYPHMTVAQNLGLALEVQRVAREERRRRVLEVAAMLGIETLLERRPAQLSGGQQQRVALGRALVRRPKLYLLDEPLSNLDASLREATRGELKQLFRSVEATVIYVTHDQVEAMSLSDRVAVLRKGRIVQLAPPGELYARPADLFVASFVGSPAMSVVHGRASGGIFTSKDLRLPHPPGPAHGSELILGVRPEDVEVSEEELEGGLAAEPLLDEPLGARTLLTLRACGVSLRALAEPRTWPRNVWIRLPPERLHWFHGEGGVRVGSPSE